MNVLALRKLEEESSPNRYGLKRLHVENAVPNTTLHGSPERKVIALTVDAVLKDRAKCQVTASSDDATRLSSCAAPLSSFPQRRLTELPKSGDVPSDIEGRDTFSSFEVRF
ncbi:hypothetical protein J6590_003424 [Homalodisca vitripennis]|nr:hypothetical protein J6590_003424 [Homalodisca vitripennis]